jgi:hypothetical protein
MRYRITARDIASGQLVAPYDTRAIDERAARDEAARLGVEILSLTALAARETCVPAAHPPGDALAEWHESRLAWKVRPGTLVRLGFEHPRWGKWLYRPLLVSALLIRTKVALQFFAAAIVGLLGMIGIQADPGAVALFAALAALALPLLLLKPWIYRQLKRTQARAGLGVPQLVAVSSTGLVVFDGRDERRLPLEQLARVYELPHFVLLQSTSGVELAIPKQAFASAARARRFAQEVAAAAGVEPDLGFRSEWLGRRHSEQSQGRIVGAFLLGFFLLIALLLGMSLLLPKVFQAFEN